MSAPAPRRDTIAQTLRDDILRGTYRPGDRLPAERDLAHRLSANRSSVREALRNLEQLGLVTIRRGGGAIVCELDRASLGVVRHMLFVDGCVNRAVLEQVLDVHEMLIAGAARLALERGSEATLARARSLVARLGCPDTSDDDFIDAVAELLELMAEASQNWVLRLARNAVDPLFEDRFREARKRLRAPADVLAPIARQLDAALASRDAATAEQAVRHLLRANRGRTLDALQAFHAPDDTPAPTA